MRGERRASRTLPALAVAAGVLGLTAGPALAGGHHRTTTIGVGVGTVYYQPTVGVGVVSGVSAAPMVGYGTLQAAPVGLMAAPTALQTQYVPVQTHYVTTPAVGATALGVPGVGSGLASGAGYVWTLTSVGAGQGLAVGANGPASLQGGDEYSVLSAQVGGPFADALVGKLRQELQRIIAASGGVMPSKQLIFQALLLIARDYFVQANGGAVFDLVLRPIVERLISRLIDEHQQQLPVNPRPAPTPSDNTSPGTLPPGRYRIQGVIDITVTSQNDGTSPATPPDQPPTPPDTRRLPQQLEPVGDPDGGLAPEID